MTRRSATIHWPETGRRVADWRFDDAKELWKYGRICLKRGADWVILHCADGYSVLVTRRGGIQSTRKSR